jgi:toxin ParE1/3/4
MLKIRVSALAESDLIGIWQYSFEESGETQADKYLEQLDSGIRKLAHNPELGMKRYYVRDESRVLFIGSLAVYYTATPEAVQIIRVLHGSMDPDSYLE